MAKDRTGRQNHGGRPQQVLKYFRGLPVIEATEPLRIVMNRDDIKKGKRLDPNNCAFAQACRRLFNSHAVLFLRRTAYVELPDAEGIRKVHRFCISSSVANAIAQFDKTGEAPEGGFLLKAPPPSRLMNTHRAYSDKYRAEIASGKRVPLARQRKRPTRYLKTMEGVRDGRGKLGINYGY